MRNLWKYLLVGLLVFGLIFVVALPFFTRGAGGYAGYGIWGPGGMMGNGGFNPMLSNMWIFGGLMMLLVFLLPLALIVMAVLGVFSLLRRATTTVTPSVSAPTRACPSCGKPAQTDWTACPYCGQKL